MTRYMKFEDVLEALNEIRCSDCSCEKPLDCSLCQIGAVYKQILTKPTYLDVAPRTEIANEIIDYIAELTEITEYLKRFDQYYQIGYCQAMNVILGGLGELKKKYTQGIVNKEEKGKCTCNECFHNCTTFCDFEHHCRKKFMELDEETDRRLGLISE